MREEQSYPLFWGCRDAADQLGLELVVWVLLRCGNDNVFDFRGLLLVKLSNHVVKLCFLARNGG
jgi:hypothetical protein